MTREQKIIKTKVGLLELAKVTATETFRSEDERTYGFKWFEVDAGTTITEIRVPVTYRYHLRMRDAWQLSVTNNVCIVHAPEIRPSQPPAIHTDKMEKSSDEGWARFNAEEQMAKLDENIVAWESSDEWYVDGDPVMKSEIDRSIKNFYSGLVGNGGDDEK